MTISSQKVVAIKVDFEAGILTKTDIAKKHKINRHTLYKQASKHKWIYGKYTQEITKITEEKSLQNLIGQQVDRATGITNQFLGDIDKHRQLLMLTTNELVKTYNEYKDKKTGVLGRIGCFSFNGNKIITAGGGGMVVTGDDQLAEGAGL